MSTQRHIVCGYKDITLLYMFSEYVDMQVIHINLCVYVIGVTVIRDNTTKFFSRDLQNISR